MRNAARKLGIAKPLRAWNCATQGEVDPRDRDSLAKFLAACDGGSDSPNKVAAVQIAQRLIDAIDRHHTVKRQQPGPFPGRRWVEEGQRAAIGHMVTRMCAGVPQSVAVEIAATLTGGSPASARAAMRRYPMRRTPWRALVRIACPYPDQPFSEGLLEKQGQEITELVRRVEQMIDAARTQPMHRRGRPRQN